MLAQAVDDGAVGVDDVVGDGGQRDVVDPLGCGDEHVVGGGDQQQVGHTATVAAPGLAESECRPGPRLVGLACRVMPFAAGCAGAAGHLEGNRDPLPGPDPGDPGADCDDFGGDLVADRIRTREDPEAGHGDVEVTAGDRERSHDRVAGPRFGIRDLLPLHGAGFGENQVSHEFTLEPAVLRRRLR